MIKKIDARGLACPEPLIKTRNALESSSQVLIIVDSMTAVENIKRFAENSNFSLEIKQKKGDTYLKIKKRPGEALPKEKKTDLECGNISSGIVIVVSEDRMGRGEDSLGYILVKSFIHTLTEAEEKPATMIFFNTGVKLAVKASEVIEDLRMLESNGTEILVCGTCLNYFNLTAELGAGVVSNMYDIKELMLTASSTINL